MNASDTRYPVPTQSYAPSEWDQRGLAPATAYAPSNGGIPGWIIAGTMFVAAGALAWYYLGPDFRRYMKIRSM